MTKPIIDVHAHILSEDMMQRMYKEAPEIGPKLSEVDADGGTLKVANVVQRPFPRGGWDLEKRFADLEFAGIDMQVLATSPQTFLYGIDKSLAVTFAQIQNEAISDLVKKYPDKFMGLAGLPLQDPEASVKELRRSMTELGLRGIHIGTHVENRNLDEPDFEPIWAEAERLGAFIVIHPHETTAANRTGKYYLKNIIGNPLETTIAGACLVYAGVLERYPNLKICFVHGGGFLPFQMGRLVHGWRERQECKVAIKESPEVSVRKLYFDTLTHFGPALNYLVDAFGAPNILLGSDYPFDMGTLECARQVKEWVASGENQDLILSKTASLLLGRK